MGSLILPPSGKIYLDTATIIYGVEQPSRWPLLSPLWERAIAGSLSLIVSELAFLEVLTGPFKLHNSALVASYEQLFRHPNFK